MYAALEPGPWSAAVQALVVHDRVPGIFTNALNDVYTKVPC